jgi:hypothetical protein
MHLWYKDAGGLWGVHFDIGLIVSNNGIHFREPIADFQVIESGKKGEWDYLQVWQGHAFANVNDKTLIWYSAGVWNDARTKILNPHIGLATLRRDGFGYLSLLRPNAAGHCVTQTIPPATQRRDIVLNVAGVAPDQPVTVELLDEADRPLADYAGENAASITWDSVHAPAIWPKAKSNRLPARQAVALRIKFPAGGKARLYAAYVVSSERVSGG